MDTRQLAGVSHVWIQHDRWHAFQVFDRRLLAIAGPYHGDDVEPCGIFGQVIPFDEQQCRARNATLFLNRHRVGRMAFFLGAASLHFEERYAHLKHRPADTGSRIDRVP